MNNYLKQNHLNLIRLILASMVIVGHSYALAPTGGAKDMIYQLTGSIHSGPLAVKIFFFISGLLVCNSIIKNPNPIKYLLSRFFRIIPALFFMLIITCFFIGPIVSTLSLNDYFSNDEVFTYFKKNINLFSPEYYYLPGVFHDNHYPKAVNGSIWTLRYEVEMYAYLLAISMLGLLKNKKVATFIFLCISLLPILKPEWYIELYTSNPSLYHLPMCFALGCIFAIWKDDISINLNFLLGVLILTYLVQKTAIYIPMLYFTCFYFVLYVSDSNRFKMPALNIDISYGVYIYGFLVQQVVNYLFPHEKFLFNAIVSLLICYPIAFLSYTLIERPSINIGAMLSSAIHKHVSIKNMSQKELPDNGSTSNQLNRDISI